MKPQPILTAKMSLCVVACSFYAHYPSLALRHKVYFCCSPFKIKLRRTCNFHLKFGFCQQNFHFDALMCKIRCVKWEVSVFRQNFSFWVLLSDDPWVSNLVQLFKNFCFFLFFYSTFCSALYIINHFDLIFGKSLFQLFYRKNLIRLLSAHSDLKSLKRYMLFRCVGMLCSNKLVHLDVKNMICFTQSLV